MLKAFLPHERHSKYSDYPEIDEVGKAYKRSAIIIDEFLAVQDSSIGDLVTHSVSHSLRSLLI